LDHFETAKVVGLTATPDRLDGKAQGDVFETVAIKRDIDFGIAEGFLVPMVLEATYIESIDVGRAKTVMGDLDESTVEEEIVKAVAPIAKAVREATPTGERSLTFTPRVASAHGVSEALNAHTIESSRCVDGKTERQLRKAILRDHKRGRFAHLLNCQVFTEGYDDPGVRIGCIARLTKSRALYVQMLGRLLRPLPGIGELPTRGERLAAIAASAKPHAIIVDITGHAGKHRLISPVDILGGRYTEDERARAKKNLTKEAGEVGKALAQARDELRAEEKAKAEATARRAAAAQIKLRRKIIDPWAVLGREDPIGEPGAPGGTTPADGYQLRWLEQAGVDIPQGCTTSQAAALMRAVTHRRAAGLCTYKQARTLGRQGFDTSKMRKDTASALVQALFDHKWHPPRALVDDILNRAREPGEEG
jgi:superfamily II DNA or RNA helicase